MAYDESQLQEAINYYLMKPEADIDKRKNFIERECTFIDGQAGKRTGDYFVSVVNRMTKGERQ